MGSFAYWLHSILYLCACFLALVTTAAATVKVEVVGLEVGHDDLARVGGFNLCVRGAAALVVDHIPGKVTTSGTTCPHARQFPHVFAQFIKRFCSDKTGLAIDLPGHGADVVAVLVVELDSGKIENDRVNVVVWHTVQ